MDDTTYVVLRTHDDDGTTRTHQPPEGRVLARGDHEQMLRVADEYTTTRYRHGTTDEVRVITETAIQRAAREGGQLATWLFAAKSVGDAGRVLVIKEADLVFYRPDPPTPGAYRVRVLVPGWATGKDADTWLPMSRVFATEGEAAVWARDLAATYRIEQEDTD